MRLKCQMLVGNVLVQDAYLEVRFVVNQLAQSRFHGSITIDKRFDSVNHTVVGDATLHDVVASPRLFALTAFDNKLKLFAVVSIEFQDIAIYRLVVFISVYDGMVCVANHLDTISPSGSLVV